MAVLAAMAFVPVSAQSILIQGKDGGTTELSIGELRKLSFEGSNMIATYNSGNRDSYAMSAIGKLQFDGSLAVQPVSLMEDHISYSASIGQAQVLGSKGQNLSVYSVSGSKLLDLRIDSDEETVDLSGLQKGVYLLKLGSRTIKIAR